MARKLLCYYCGKKLIRERKSPRFLTRDHLQPRSRGGHSEHANLVLSCRHCNNEKGNKTLKEYRKQVAEKRGVAETEVKFWAETTHWPAPRLPIW